MFHNPELKFDLYVFIALALVMSAIGFFISIPCGLMAFVSCALGAGVHFRTERKRYTRLQNLTADLDELVQSDVPLSMDAYTEGEVAVLANQIQKMTVHLLESRNLLKAEKAHLAESLADISHQLRTPLTAMNLTASMLGAADLKNERRYELVFELRNLLNWIEWLTESLLKLSRLDAGVVTMTRETIPVCTLISRSAAPLAIPMDLRNQKLIINCDNEHFFGDVSWTSEALGNILKNSVEHTPDGGNITVSAEETVLFTQITVEDTGTGFDPADIPHLFERFYKGANASQSSYGIGLALARNIIVAQNGTIQAMNGSVGAKFTIKFYKQIV